MGPATAVAEDIRGHIAIGTLMALSATAMGAAEVEGLPALTFSARIAPFDKDGLRSARSVKMTIHVAKAADETYTVIASQVYNGQYMEHARAEGVGVDRLNSALIALDYDGDTAFNPRLRK